MPKVYNLNNTYPKDAVYIGRGSPYGNPFVIGVHGTREEVIQQHKEYLEANPKLIDKIKQELKGKNLVCHCAPSACHGDTILIIANEQEEWM